MGDRIGGELGIRRWRGEAVILLHSVFSNTQLLTGRLHHDGPTCTHLGCPLRWNDAERSWDCHCHGSRFGTDGSILDGPATKPLDAADAAAPEQRPS